LRFPHHEAEIFQSECHTGHAPLAGYWLHNGFVNIDGEKMSKSLGNFWTIRDIIQKVDPLVLRLALVNAHYRSPIDMNEQLLNDAQRNHARILQVYEAALRMATEGRQHTLPSPDLSSADPLVKSLGLLERLAEGFAQAMDDDFNSREAVAKVLAATKQLQHLMTLGSDEQDKRAIATYAKGWLEETAGDILGILPSPDVLLAEPEEDPRKAQIAEQVEALLIERSEARANKDWGQADAIRDQLNELGVVVTDTADGPVWDLQ
jgi:cysteinyl-tRNA synthetase